MNFHDTVHVNNDEINIINRYRKKNQLLYSGVSIPSDPWFLHFIAVFICLFPSVHLLNNAKDTQVYLQSPRLYNNMT